MSKPDTFDSKTISSERSRHVFPALDGFRGVAALIVFLFHFNMLSGNIHCIAAEYGFLAVDFFFTLSGFVISNAYDARLYQEMTLYKFILLRFIRLYPMFLVGGVLSLAYCYVFYPPEYVEPNMMWKSAALYLLMLPSFSTVGNVLYWINPPMWSILFEMITNLIHANAQREKRTSPPLIKCFISAVLMLIFINYYPSTFDGATWSNSIMSLTRAIFSFFLGVILQKIYRSNTITFHFPAIILYVLLIGYFLIPVPKRHLGMYEIIFIFFISPLLVFFGARAKPTHRIRSLYSALGNMSYPLYTVHSPIILIAQQICSHYGLNPSQAYWIMAPFMMITPFMALALYKYCELPVRKYLTKKLVSPHD